MVSPLPRAISSFGSFCCEGIQRNSCIFTLNSLWIGDVVLCFLQVWARGSEVNGFCRIDYRVTFNWNLHFVKLFEGRAFLLFPSLKGRRKMTLLWLCLAWALAGCQGDLQQQGEKSKGKTVHPACGQLGWGLWEAEWRPVCTLPVKSCQGSFLFRAWNMMSAEPTSSSQGRWKMGRKNAQQKKGKQKRVELATLLCRRECLALEKCECND